MCSRGRRGGRVVRFEDDNLCTDDDDDKDDPGAVNGRGTTDGYGGTYRGDNFPSFGAANNATKN